MVARTLPGKQFEVGRRLRCWLSGAGPGRYPHQLTTVRPRRRDADRECRGAPGDRRRRRAGNPGTGELMTRRIPVRAGLARIHPGRPHAHLHSGADHRLIVGSRVALRGLRAGPAGPEQIPASEVVPRASSRIPITPGPRAPTCGAQLRDHHLDDADHHLDDADHPDDADQPARKAAERPGRRRRHRRRCRPPTPRRRPVPRRRHPSREHR